MTDDRDDTQRVLRYRDEAHVLTKERDDLHAEVERLRGERDEWERIAKDRYVQIEDARGEVGHFRAELERVTRERDAMRGVVEAVIQAADSPEVLLITELRALAKTYRALLESEGTR